MSSDELFKNIVAACPPFEAQVAEHIADNDEILGHVLMGDVGRLVESHFTGSSTIAVGPPTEDQVRAVLGVLDQAMLCGDAYTQNVIAVSFVEYLDNEPYFDRLEPMLGPGLRLELERQQKWLPE